MPRSVIVTAGMNSSQELPAVAVIVPHYRHENRLRACLTHLLAQDYLGAVAIYVVDNSEHDTLADWLDDFPQVLFMWEPRPGSYQARNQAIGHSRAEIIAFTDADCRPRPDWLRHGVHRLLSDDRIGSVGGRVQVTPRNPSAPDIADLYEMATAFRQNDFVCRQGFAVTANMFTRRAVFKQVGLFDPRLKSNGDHQWGTLVSKSGYQVVYEPHAVVEHDARTHEELQCKAKRLAGGNYDRRPGWVGCAGSVGHNIKMTFRETAIIFGPAGSCVPWRKKFSVALFCSRYRCLIAFVRIRHELFRHPTAR